MFDFVRTRLLPRREYCRVGRECCIAWFWFGRRVSRPQFVSWM
jgi:hypothetical protein